VDFPAPFGPRNPKTSPFSTENEILSTASFGPKLFVNFSTVIIFGVGHVNQLAGVRVLGKAFKKVGCRNLSREPPEKLIGGREGFCARTGETGKASHRGHRGHRGGRGFDGGGSFREHRGLRARNKPTLSFTGVLPIEFSGHQLKSPL
jgi:hypothetical protein